MEFIKVTEPKIGKEYFIPSEDGKSMIPCLVVSGQLWSNGRISNAWEWINLLTRRTESGYGGFFELKQDKNEVKRGMMTAKEAREQVVNSISDKTKEQLICAECCIESAVKSGEMSVWCDKYLGKQAIEKLNELGYKVENYSSQKDGTAFKISW